MKKVKNIFKLFAFWFLRLVYIIKQKSFSGGPFRVEEIKKILLVETALLGDVIAVVPMCKAITDKFPKAEVTVVIQEKYRALLQTNPYIYNLETLDHISLRSLMGLILRLRRCAFDLVVAVSPGVRNSLLALFSGRSYITGYLVNYSTNTYYYQDQYVDAVGIQGQGFCEKNEHITVRALKSILLTGTLNTISKSRPELYISLDKEKHFLDSLEKSGYINSSKINLVLHPGASWPFRRWPIENFTRLLNSLYNIYGIRLNVTVIGIPSERDVFENIEQAVSIKPKFLVSPDLEALMVLFKHCDLFVGNDSGPKFIADGFNVPLVELLGPLRPETVGAVSSRAVTFFYDVSCNPCTQQKCYNNGLCVKSISVDEVFNAITGIVNKIVDERSAPLTN